MRVWKTGVFASLFFLLVFSLSCLHTAQAQLFSDQVQIKKPVNQAEDSQDKSLKDSEVQETAQPDEIAGEDELEAEEAKIVAEEAKIEVEAAKQELQIQQKAVEIEKKKAEVKIQEAETAKKEAETVKDTARTRDEISKAQEKAKLKEREALTALEQVNIAQEKVRTAQEKARLAEEELQLAVERANIAESKIKEKRIVMYKKLFETGVIVLVGYLLLLLLVRIINRRVKDIRVRHMVRKNVSYIITFLVILYITFVWIQNISSITLFLSVMGAGIALALQEVILCIAGWVLILLRHPFEIGDRIELGGVKGDVIDIRLFQTTLLEIGNWVEADQSTGRIVNIPNSAVFKHENFNYNRGFEFIWNEIKVLVTFESDWKKAEEIMLRHGNETAEGIVDIVKNKIRVMTRSYMIFYENLSPIVYVEIKDSGVQLSLRYLTEAKQRRSTQDKICRDILNEFEKEEKVNFAYPTYRIVK